MATINYVLVLIGVTVAAIVGANVLIPVVQTSTDGSVYSEDLVVASGENITDTLTQSDLVASSLSITGLTLTDNYTVDYNTGVVSFVNGTTAGTYVAEYEYYASTYVDNTTERTLLRFVILAFIIGLIAYLFYQVGM